MAIGKLLFYPHRTVTVVIIQIRSKRALFVPYEWFDTYRGIRMVVRAPEPVHSRPMHRPDFWVFLKQIILLIFVELILESESVVDHIKSLRTLENWQYSSRSLPRGFCLKNYNRPFLQADSVCNFIYTTQADVQTHAQTESCTAIKPLIQPKSSCIVCPCGLCWCMVITMCVCTIKWYISPDKNRSACRKRKLTTKIHE